MELHDDGIHYRSGLKLRLARYDDIERLEGRVAHVRDGRTVQVSRTLAGALAEILAGPRTEGSVAEVGQSVSRYASGPHAPVLLARKLLELGERLGASDIHIEAAVGHSAVRLRLAGELTDLCALPAEVARRVGAALKGLAGCLPYRSDIVQEGRIARSGVCADIRASFLPTALGERIALRLFGKLRRLEDLELEPRLLASLTEALASRQGLFLVAGASGAGKTTTLYAALAHVASQRGGAHLSLEDPVEQRLRAAGIPVDQIELDAERGLTAEAMLVAALRQDVDVLCLGEIRTSAEARLAVEAAHTGRLVLAGLHAGSAAEARQRMRDLGADDKLLATTLRGVLFQELRTEPCGCSLDPGCARCRGLGRWRRVDARLEPVAGAVTLREVA